MACILHIDTSTDICSVAVSEDSHVIFAKDDCVESRSVEGRLQGKNGKLVVIR